MFKRLLLLATCLLLFVAAQSRIHAQDLFGVTVLTNSDSRLEVSSSAILNVIENAVKRQGEFALLSGTAFRGDVTYFGYRDAFFVEVSADALTVRIGSRLVGQEDFILTGISDVDTYEKLEAFLKEAGVGFWSEIQKEIAKVSAASVNDGNPAATTGTMSRLAFETFGKPFSRYYFLHETKGTPPTGGWWVDLSGELQGQQFSIDTEVGEIDGFGANFRVPFGFDWGRRFSLKAVGELTFTELEGTRIYGGGLQAGAQYHLQTLSEDEHVFWYITPFAGLGGRASVDAISGALLIQGGVNHVFGYRFSDHFLLSWRSQVEYLRSVGVEVEGVDYEPGIRQGIVRSGLRADMPIAEKWQAHLEVSGAAFLEDAAVDEWLTFRTGFDYVPFRLLAVGAYLQQENGNRFLSRSAGLRVTVQY